jgi:hypothetical protein
MTHTLRGRVPAQPATDVITAAMTALAARRPLFHSESDWQFALAWVLQQQHPDAQIRLEVPIPTAPRRINVDILAVIGGIRHALELKYPRPDKTVIATLDGERYELRPGAKDVERYGIIKDVARCERMLAGGHADTATAVVLTARRLWKPDPTRTTSIRDAEFRLHDGHTLAGTVDWHPTTAPTVRRANPGPLVLAGQYPLTGTLTARSATTACAT